VRGGVSAQRCQTSVTQSHTSDDDADSTKMALASDGEF